MKRYFEQLGVDTAFLQRSKPLPGNATILLYPFYPLQEISAFAQMPLVLPLQPQMTDWSLKSSKYKV